MMDQPDKTYQVRFPEPTLSAEERALEESLRAVRPAPLSPDLRAELRGLSARAVQVPGRFDRAAKLALPWACAACLALGFLVGMEARTGAPIEAPTVTHPTVLVSVDEMGDFGAAWRAGEFEGDTSGATRAGRGEAELPRLQNPYLSI